MRSSEQSRFSFKMRTKQLPKVTLLFSLLVVTGCAPTQPLPENSQRPNLQELRNPQADFDVKLWSERKVPLVIDEILQLKMRVTVDAYVNLYAITTAGDTVQLLGNYPVPAKETISLGGVRGPVVYRVREPPGKETYILVVTRQPLTWLTPSDIKNKNAMTTLNLTPSQLIRRLHGALREHASTAWQAAIMARNVEWPRGSSFQ